MTKPDLSAFRQNYVKDSVEDMKKIAEIKSVQRIPEGAHEVVITGVHEKDGVKYKLNDTLGGTLGFSLVVKDAQRREQLLYVAIPLHVNFLQACLDKDSKISFQFKNSVDNIQSMGVDAILLREAVLATDCDAIESLVGAQFVVVNTWDARKLHLEYDELSKAHVFVNSNGERFTSGEIAAPIKLDLDTDIKKRYVEATAIAIQHGYQLATQMRVKIDTHPTASNDKINEALEKAVQPKEKKVPVLINKTIPAFPKKIVPPLSIEPDNFIEE